MKIEVEVAKIEKKEVEVEFPLFMEAGDSFDNGGWYDTYYRIEMLSRDRFSRYKITERDDKWEYEIETIGKTTLGGMLSNNSYYYRRSTSKQFYAKLAEFQKTLAEIPKEAA